MGGGKGPAGRTARKDKRGQRLPPEKDQRRIWAGPWRGMWDLKGNAVPQKYNTIIEMS